MESLSLCLAICDQYKPDWITRESIQFQYRYVSVSDEIDTDDYFRKLSRNIIIFNNKKNQIRKEMTDLIREIGDNTRKWYFTTIGYDDENITIDKIKGYTKKLLCKEHFRNVELVNEKHRRGEDGKIYIHHHVHILFESDLPKSKIIDRIFDLVNKSVKSKNFIDVKGYKDKDLKGRTYESCLKYIKGDKQKSKTECLELDRNWRMQNNL